MSPPARSWPGWQDLPGRATLWMVEPCPQEDARPPGDGAPASRVALGALLAGCAGGERTAFGHLYDAAAPRVYGLVLEVVRDPCQAEDVTREAFAEAWRTSAGFCGDRESALGWLAAIGHQMAVELVRSGRTTGSRETGDALGESVGPYAAVEQAHPGPDAQRVRTALATLPAEQRQAVELAYFGGCTHHEVARALGLPVGAAVTRIHDGLAQLAHALGPV